MIYASYFYKKLNARFALICSNSAQNFKAMKHSMFEL